MALGKSPWVAGTRPEEEWEGGKEQGAQQWEGRVCDAAWSQCSWCFRLVCLRKACFVSMLLPYFSLIYASFSVVCFLFLFLTGT